MQKITFSRQMTKPHTTYNRKEINYEILTGTIDINEKYLIYSRQNIYH